MNSIKTNFLYNSFYQLLIILIPLVTTPYLSRILGADGIGQYSFYNSIANYFGIFVLLGINNYGNREVAKHREARLELSNTFWNVYYFQFLSGLIVSILYLIFCFFIAKESLLALIFGFYVISCVFDINWFFFGIERFKLTVSRNTIIKVINTVLIFVFIKEADDVWKYCLIMALGLLVSQIVLWPYLFKTIDFVKPNWSSIKPHIKPNLFLFLSVLAVSLFKIMDKIMLGLISTKEQVGLYESSEKIIAIPTALIISLGAVMLPRISNIVSKDENYMALIDKSIIFAMMISSSLCFGIMSVSKEFVPWFYGPGFEICIILYQILLPSCVFLAFANVIRTQYLLPNQMDKHYIKSAFLGAGVNIVLNLFLIPFFQAAGAAIGTLVAEFVVCFYQSYIVRDALPIRHYLVSAIPFVFSGIIMFGLLYSFSLSSMLVSVLVKICIGIVLYPILVFILVYFTNKNEFFSLKQLVKGILSRKR